MTDDGTFPSDARSIVSVMILITGAGERCGSMLSRSLALLLEKPIAGPQTQGSNLGKGIGPGLKDDQEHSDGRRLLAQHQPITQLRSRQHFPDRLFGRGDGLDPVHEGLNLMLRQS
eukprot:scaffold1340_cov253-Pinguiococcus_pyrenoidosus.AAC.40